MYEASKIIGVVAKIARNPEAAIEEILAEADTEAGKAVIDKMKESLCKRYSCKSIDLETTETGVSINMREVDGDIDKTTQIIISDLKEIMAYASIASKKVDVKSLLRKIKLSYNENEKWIRVLILVEGKLFESIKKILGGDVKNG